ncbi:flagellar basal body M-ring protein FliF [bacterium Scap17]|nr:flagellar basal body M-ring protein FliF [bacterium Scap17]
MSTPSQTAPQSGTSTTSQSPDKPANPLLPRLAALPRLPLIMAAAFSVAVIVALLLWGAGTQWSVLYRDLPASEGGEIVAQLEQTGVPYRLSNEGATVEVPKEDVYRLRLALAQQGLPSQGGSGFELMDTQAFGISQFTEHVNYQRALSGELSRTIASLDPVSSARVHLALPEDSVFVRERRPATASVVVELKGGQQLKARQIQAIQHLVAGSVQGLASEDITVVDQDGNPLSRPAGDALNLDGSALEYAQALERRYQSRINALLTPLVGRDNFRAEVSAQLDFSHAEETEEHYTPNQQPGSAAVRSEQLNNTGAGEMLGIGGVPGALSNTPPGIAASPINADDAANADGTTQTDDAASGLSNYQRSSTINYEVNKRVRHTRARLGRLDNLSVAVVINHRRSMDSDGNPTSEPLADDQLAQIESLVREAMGFNVERGDSLSVINAPFMTAEQRNAGPPQQWWEKWLNNTEMQALAIELGRYLIIGFIAWLLYRKLLKPLLIPQQNPQDSQPIGQLGEPPGASHRTPDLRESDSSTTDHSAKGSMPTAGYGELERDSHHQHNLKKAQDMAREDPRLVAMILKNWMSHDD